MIVLLNLAFCNPIVQLNSLTKTCIISTPGLQSVRTDRIKYSPISSTTLYSNADESQSSGSDITNDPSRFFELISPSCSVKPDQMNASTLAYLGDVVFELFIRSRYVWPERRMSDLQNKVVSLVRADAQALLLKKFIESFPLTQEEKSVMARGRNANLSARKKMKGTGSSGTSATDFQDSTAFEALLGYTFISDKMRFADMMDTLKFELDKIDTQ